MSDPNDKDDDKPAPGDDYEDEPDDRDSGFGQESGGLGG